MKTNTEYLKNPKTKFEKWLSELDKKSKLEFENNYPNLEWKHFEYTKGKKYIKIIRARSVWGFVSMVNDVSKNEKVGDLLKAASWRAPAKHSRGNIFDGTASYTLYGPMYL